MPVLPQLASGDFVYIKWHDSSHLPGWQYRPLLLELGVIESVGIVVEASPGVVIITSAINEEGATLTPLAIPTSCITELKLLERKQDERVSEATSRQAC